MDDHRCPRQDKNCRVRELSPLISTSRNAQPHGIGPMGSQRVMAQNCYFSAKQNAKRLHGAPDWFRCDVQSSPPSCIPYIGILVGLRIRRFITCVRNKMKKVSRAVGLIDKMVANKTLTPEGRDWLITALDPFHDLDHQVAGYPDADSSQTTVSVYQYATDVAKPGNITTATWDAHIFTLPFTTANGAAMGLNDGLIDATRTEVELEAAPASINFNMVNVMTNNANSSLFPTTHAEATAPTLGMINLPLNDQFNGTNSRIIGMAVEVVDTTAEVYKQGSLTVYKLPQNKCMSDLYMVGPVRVFERSPTAVYRTPPPTVADALKLVGSRQWAARDGCYSLVTQSTVDNPLNPNEARWITMWTGARIGAAHYALHSPPSHHGLAANAPPIPSAASPAYSLQMVPFNSTGIMLCGLNAASTFRVKVKMIVESAPAPWQSDLVVLASPSAPYDPIALEAYSKTLASLPVGVPASENGLGDWFAGLADIVSKIALPVSTALTPFFPLAPVVGAGVGVVSNWAKQVAQGQKKNDAVYPNRGKLVDAASSLKPKKKSATEKPAKRKVTAGMQRLRDRLAGKRR